MRAFCEDLAVGPWLSLPIADATQRWGSALERLRDAGVLQVRSAGLAGTYPCHGSAGCIRELVQEGDSWLAVCSMDSPFCEPEAVDPRFADVVEPGLHRFLAVACGVEGPVVGDALVELGGRRLERHAFHFTWCHRPQLLDLAAIERLAEAVAPDALVVLVPARRTLQRVVPARLGRTRVFWLPLDEVLTLEHTVRVDLSELWLRFGLGSIELLWPRYDLVLDAANALWGGTWVELARHPQYRQLLDLLLAAKGEYVSRGDLLPTLFPDEFTNRGRMLSDPGKLDRRLRQLVSRVNAHFGDHPNGDALIGNLRGRSDIDGGYRLDVAPDRFFTTPGVLT